MQRSVWNDIVSWQTRRLNNSKKYLLHASMTTTSKSKKWNLLENCQIHALKLFWNAHTWHALEGLIFYGQSINLHDRSQNGPTHVTNDMSFDLLHSKRMWLQTILSCVKHCQTMQTDCDRFKTPILQDILRTQNLLQVEHCAYSEVIRLCKKQTSFSQSSTESGIISLDAGLRLYGITALDLWDLIVAILHGNTCQSTQERWDPCTNLLEVRAAPRKLPKRKKSHGKIDDLDNVDLFPQTWILLVRKLCCMCLKTTKQWSKWLQMGRSPTMRHVSRTDRVALDWLIDRISLGPKIQIKYIDTKNQLADILTKGKFHAWWMESSFVSV